MKLRAFAAAVLALMLLCSCGTDAAQPPIQPAEPSAPFEPGLITDGNPAKTPIDYFDRTAIIRRGDTLEGSFMQTELWALEYIGRTYSDCSVTSSFESGYAAPEGMFRGDGLSAGSATWTMNMTDPNGEQQSTDVQVLYFSEEEDGIRTLSLSGLLAGEDRLKTRPEGYAYLALDTRFSGRMQRLPEITPPEHTLTVPLGRFAPEASAVNAYPLSSSVCALHALSHQSGKQQELIVCNIETGEELARRELPRTWGAAGLENGVLTLENYDYREDGLREQMTVSLSRGLPVFEENTVRENRWQIGGHTVYAAKNSLWEGEIAILSGSEEEFGPGYTVLSVLDDHRFLYGCFGWEMVDHYGIYDLEAETDRILYADRAGTKPIDTMPVISGQLRKGLTAEIGESGYWTFSVADFDTGALSPVPVLLPVTDSAPAGSVTVNDDFDRLAMFWQTENNEWNLQVFDLESGESLLLWTVPAAAVAGDPHVELIGSDCLQVSLCKWTTDSYWLYSISYDLE